MFDLPVKRKSKGSVLGLSIVRRTGADRPVVAQREFFTKIKV